MDRQALVPKYPLQAHVWILVFSSWCCLGEAMGLWGRWQKYISVGGLWTLAPTSSSCLHSPLLGLLLCEQLCSTSSACCQGLSCPRPAFPTTPNCNFWNHKAKRLILPKRFLPGILLRWHRSRAHRDKTFCIVTICTFAFKQANAKEGFQNKTKLHPPGIAGMQPPAPDAQQTCTQWISKWMATSQQTVHSLTL